MKTEDVSSKALKPQPQLMNSSQVRRLFLHHRLQEKAIQHGKINLNENLLTANHAKLLNVIQEQDAIDGGTSNPCSCLHSFIDRLVRRGSMGNLHLCCRYCA